MNKKILDPKIVHHDEQKGRLKSKGQSLVEFAIAFPVIIILFSGLIEFGFMLNYYLSLLDATRESARYWSNFDPFDCGVIPRVSDPDHCTDINFYNGAVSTVLENLQPQDLAHPELDSSHKLIFDPATDNVIVAVIAVNGPNIGDLIRYPLTGDVQWRPNGVNSGLTNDKIHGKLVSGATNRVVLLVEVYYAYHQILALPWLNVFLPNPMLIHAYTIMPMPETTKGVH